MQYIEVPRGKRFSNWDIDLQLGHTSEDYVKQVLTIVNDRATFEVKFDIRASETGNVFIEYRAEGTDGTFYPSGISTSKATHTTFVFDGGATFIAPTEDVRAAMKSLQSNPRVKVRECRLDKRKSRGLVIPIALLVPTLIEIGSGKGLPQIEQQAA